MAIDLFIDSGADALQLAIPGTRNGIATERAVRADGRRFLQIPVTAFETERPVGKDTGRANIDQVAGKLAFQPARLEAPEKDPVARSQHPEVLAAEIVAVGPHATVALDAAIHLLLDKRPEILVDISPLVATVIADAVAAGDGHVLQLALAALVAHRAVVGVVDHQPLDNTLAQLDRRRFEGVDNHAFLDLDEAGHHHSALTVVFDVNRTKPAGADRPERLVVAEMRHHDTELLGGVENGRPGGNGDALVVDCQSNHKISHRVTEAQRIILLIPSFKTGTLKFINKPRFLSINFI